jgi:hypothetical protein
MIVTTSATTDATTRVHDLQIIGHIGQKHTI